DYLVIIEWLKIKQNYNSCFGTGKAPDVDEGLIQHLQRQVQEIPQQIHFHHVSPLSFHEKVDGRLSICKPLVRD
ncbi:hypothetical protein VP01_165g1, partial [Puccinia sorghi]